MRWVFAGLAVLWGLAVSAHEVMPAIADLAVTDGDLTLVMQVNAEALVVIQGQGEVDGEADHSEAYFALRALDPDALRDQTVPVAQDLAMAITLTSGGAPVPLEVARIDIGPIGDMEFARESTLVLNAKLEDPAAPFELAWPSGYGMLVLRQVDVTSPFTGFLDGGQSTGQIFPDGY